jgi:hypothetical protein
VSVEAPRVERRAFSVVTALTSTGSNGFAAVIDPEWTIGGKPNGGYLLAILGRAAQSVGSVGSVAGDGSVAGHRHVIAASATFLRSPDPGNAVVTATVLRAGRSATQVRAALFQGATQSAEAQCVEALITLAALDPDVPPYWSGGLPAAGTTPFADCERLPPRLPNGMRVAIMEQVEIRMDPNPWGWTAGQPSGRGELRGWLALPDREDFSPLSLLYAVDAFPPAVFDIARTGWVPTLSMSVYVRARPAPGPVRVLFQAYLIDDGRVDETCFVWDSEGRLVAQGTQLAGLRL